MTSATKKALISMARNFGPPQLGSCLKSFDGDRVEYFSVEWPESPGNAVIFAASPEFCNPKNPVPVMDFDEAVLKLTFGAFP